MPPQRRTNETRISRQTISDYQRLVDRQADKGGEYIRRALDAYMSRNPDADVATVRKWLFELMQTALPSFTELSETLSCEFMSELASVYGWEDVRPEIVGSTNYQLVNKRLHYLAGYLADGDERRFKDEVVDVTRYFIRRAAQDSMIENCGKANVRYARVPSGLETCSFCFMLASRGFVYVSEETAGKRHQFHNHCTCTIVPGAEGRTKIDGYDPKTMYQNWLSCADTVGVQTHDRKEPWSDEERKAVMREVETRDWHWLYTGEVPKVTYESEALRVDMEENRPHELETIRLLSENGFPVDARESSKSHRTRIADTLIGSQKWELKSPEGNSFLTIKNQLKSNIYGQDHSTINPQSDKVIISNVRTSMSMDDMIAGLGVALDPIQGLRPEELAEITEVILLDKTGKMRRFRIKQ